MPWFWPCCCCCGPRSRRSGARGRAAKASRRDRPRDRPRMTAPGATDGIPPAACPAPVEEASRIAPNDVLRGFALLGILVMNIQSFSMIDVAYINPTAYGDLTGANYWVWVLCHVFADLKFMSIFSMLFGAGILLMTERVEARGGRAAPLHYRRMAWLVLFGLLHSFLLWTGDILYTYGLCGMVVYLFRKRSSRTLIAAGLLALAVGSALSLGVGWWLRTLPEEEATVF